jgi:hypothetical protein
MKIGPIPSEQGEAFAFVACGASEVDVELAPSDAHGLSALTARCGGETLVCEEALAGVARKLKLRVEDPPQRALAFKATLAVNLDHGALMLPLAPSILLELIEVTQAMAEGEIWNAFESDQPIAIRLEPGGILREGCVMG